jgi:RnfABCDGE-type electron transport complex B subunit
MGSILLAAVLSLSIIGILSAVILYFVAQKFKVFEDPRIDEVEQVLPGANCGGCGFPGCRGFADACVKADSLEEMLCPVGGSGTMEKIAAKLGLKAGIVEPLVAVVRCNGTPEFRKKNNVYDGSATCVIASAFYTGESDCPFGCLGYGDCVNVCKFDAMRMNPQTGLPEIIDNKCVSCNACVKACPRLIIELRKKHTNDSKIFVSCINKDKGAIARKACTVACIGCGKCVKVCPHNAIVMENNLAFIDSNKCKLCRKCYPVCPTNSIHEINLQALNKQVEKVDSDIKNS